LTKLICFVGVPSASLLYDADFNAKADQARWVNTGGSRWGIDEDENGTLDAWKSLSAEEATAEIVAALKARDPAIFARLLPTKDDLVAAGFAEPLLSELLGRAEKAGEDFAGLAKAQQQIGAEAQWNNMLAALPGLLPAGTPGVAKDVLAYDNVVALIDAGAKGSTGQVYVGSLLRCGDVWRPIDAPQVPGAQGEIAETHQVSIGTVRKAIDSLVADGVLERFQGKGTFVRRPDFQSSFFRFFRFASAGGAVRVPVSRILKREETTMTVVVAAALGLKAGAPAIRFSRLRLIEDRPLVLEDIWLPHDRFKALLTIDTREFGDLLYPLYEQYCGVMVASAQETLSAEAVSAKNARLLELEAGEPVIVIERVALSADRQPLEWRQSRGPASEFRYQVEIR